MKYIARNPERVAATMKEDGWDDAFRINADKTVDVLIDDDGAWDYLMQLDMEGLLDRMVVEETT